MSKIKSFFQRYKQLIGIVLFYLLLTKAAHTLLYTIISTVVLMAQKKGTEFSSTVNEIAGQYVFVAYAAGAGLLSLLLWLGDKALYQKRNFWNGNHKKFWNLERFAKRDFLRGFSSGAVIAFMFLLILSFSKQISYLGIYLTSALGTPVFPLFFSDALALLLYIFCEEYLFQHKILFTLSQNGSATKAVLLTSLAYIFIKYIQFPLQGFDIINLFLLNIALCYYYLNQGRAHRGLGFLASLLFLLHAMGGLPLWSQSSPSFFLFKHSTRAAPWLTGGEAGPMASFSITCALIYFAITSYLSWRRTAPVTG